MILQNFDEWVERRRRQFVGHGYSVESMRCGEEFDNPAARLDLESDVRLARITIWTSGECDTEILDVVSEKTEFYLHQTIRDNQNLDEAFQKFLHALGIRER